MHIVFLTNEYPKIGLAQGGVGSFVYDLSRKLIENGIEISVVGINNEYKDEQAFENGIDIYRIKRSTWKVAKFFQNSRRIIKLLNIINKKKKIDIVEGAELSFAFFPTKTSYKKVIRLHGGHHFFSIELKNKISKWKAFQEKRSFKNADNFVAVSNYVGNQTQQYLNYKFNYTTIYNSVDAKNFKKSDLLKVQKNTILFVGTVCEKKGIRQLIESLPLIKQKYPSIKLNVVGRDWFFKDGSSYTENLKKAIPNDLKEHIEFFGAIPHTKIPLFIESAEICVYPSHMEAMPIAWLEGLLMGKPVVASNIGPGIEAIINEKTGLLVNPNDPTDIAEKIMLLLKDKKSALDMGNNARKHSLGKFNAELILKENINFYKMSLL